MVTPDTVVQVEVPTFLRCSWIVAFSLYFIVKFRAGLFVSATTVLDVSTGGIVSLTSYVIVADV